MACVDFQGNEVKEYLEFQPTYDPCHRCQCLNGTANFCLSASCMPPPCKTYITIPDVCCGFTCVNESGISNVKLGSIIIFSLVAIFLLMFLVYRYKAKRDILCLKSGRRRGCSTNSNMHLQAQWAGINYAESPPAYNSPEYTANASLPPPYSEIYHRTTEGEVEQSQLHLDCESGDFRSNTSDICESEAGIVGRNPDDNLGANPPIEN